ncbi:MAG: MaoC family dehydratase N-terminal domain-containing protein, partial [Myxococcales bacterium]|nr:MaoC family dehydratase N-terminal domain-containing protein [Myxococcales bacterium]
VKGTGVFTLVVADGTCTFHKGAVGEPSAVVTFDSADTILGMADGSVQPQQAFMAGKIKATDLGQLMTFGKVFDMAKAKATAEAGGGSGSSGGDAPQSKEALVGTIFERMPEAFLPEKAAGWNANLRFVVGDAGTYTLAIEKGSCKSMSGAHGSPSCTITFASADVLIGMVDGSLKAEKAFMEGKIKADNMAELMKFGQCFDMQRGAKAKASGGPSGEARGEGLNRECLGRKYKTSAVFVHPDEIAAYARATDDDNSRYLSSEPACAPPLIAVRPFMDVVGTALADKALNADLLRLVHGEQDMVFHRLLRPWDLVAPRAEILSIEDKSSGQLLQVKQLLWADGELVCETTSGYFIRGKGPKPAGGAAKKPEPEAVQRSYIFEATQTVSDDQPLRYAEASGDKNPIHTDPKIAKSAGHPNVILHGLCTMAFAQRAVVNHFLDGDPSRLKRLKVRFSKVVFPGDVLTTRAWREGESEGRVVLGFETVNQNGQAVLSNALAEVVA